MTTLSCMPLADEYVTISDEVYEALQYVDTPDQTEKVGPE